MGVILFFDSRVIIPHLTLIVLLHYIYTREYISNQILALFSFGWTGGFETIVDGATK